MFVEAEEVDEGSDEPRIERKRSALEDDRRLDRRPLCETADRLTGDGIQCRQREFLASDTLVEERLNIRFCFTSIDSCGTCISVPEILS